LYKKQQISNIFSGMIAIPIRNCVFPKLQKEYERKPFLFCVRKKKLYPKYVSIGTRSGALNPSSF
jgi:hypothetical protein